MTLPHWSYAEIALHNKAEDCWLVIEDNVYDVTAFVPRHPGGNMIYLNAGRESTRLFESYHPERVKELLGKYLIGRVKDSNQFRVKFANDKEDRAFYERLKSQVIRHFKEKKMDPRFSWGMYFKCCLILATFICAFFLTHFFFDNFWWCAVSAALMGFCASEVGICIQHDANHGAFHTDARINKWVGTTLDFVGASSFIWKQQHVFGHHVYTNVNSLDPDIRVKDPDVRRTTFFQPWQSYHVYQHLYLGFLYGLLAIKSIFIDDFVMLATGIIGKVPVNHLHFEEMIVFFTGKLFYFFYYLILPVLYSHHTLPELLGLWIIAQLVSGWSLAFMFQVSHLSEDLDFYEVEGEKLSVGWARSQIEGSSGYAHGSWFWTNVSGGLNYQVEHHLFPWICHMHYPEIAPIVKEACKKEGIKYVAYPTFFSALRAHFTHMKNTGKGHKLE